MLQLQMITYKRGADGKQAEQLREAVPRENWSQAGGKTVLRQGLFALDITGLFAGDHPKFVWAETPELN